MTPFTASATSDLVVIVIVSIIAAIFVNLPTIAAGVIMWFGS